MVRAGPMKSVSWPQGISVKPNRSASNSVCGISPISGTVQPKRMATAVDRIIPSNEAGKRAFHFDGMKTIVRITMLPKMTARQSTVKPP